MSLDMVTPEIRHKLNSHGLSLISYVDSNGRGDKELIVRCDECQLTWQILELGGTWASGCWLCPCKVSDYVYTVIYDNVM